VVQGSGEKLKGEDGSKNRAVAVNTPEVAPVL